MFEAHDFTTSWHLTDIKNLETIAAHGLLSHSDVERFKIQFHEVGWSGIRNKRETQDKVLSFVQPFNDFIRGRIHNHAAQRPGGEGLCLLEIDLRCAIGGRFGHTMVTSGNVVTKSIPINSGPITKFAAILHWGALLAATDETVARFDASTPAQRRTAGQAEILLPSPVPRHAIRRVLISSRDRQKLQTTGLRHFETLFADRFFELQPRSIPLPAALNFRIEWSESFPNGDIGRARPGDILGNIGTRLLVRRVGNRFQVEQEPLH